MLNQIEFQLLQSKGYQFQSIEPLPSGYRATAVKGPHVAAALGRDPQDAARKLVALVVRP